MEEWVGLQWHRWVTGRAEPARPGAACLTEHRRTVELMLHAGGGTQRHVDGKCPCRPRRNAHNLSV